MRVQLIASIQDCPPTDVNDLYRRIEKLGEGSYATVYKSESM